MLQKINLADKLASFTELWSPKIIGELNGQYVKVVKFQGEYVWHCHTDEDEMFLIIDGHMDLHLRDGIIGLDPGEFIIVPHGVEHKPVAERETQVLLFEPASTRNTGNVNHKYTIEAEDLDRI